MDCGVKIYTMKFNDEFLKKFEKNFTKNVKLSNYSWFNLGGDAEFFFKGGYFYSLAVFIHSPKF